MVEWIFFDVGSTLVDEAAAYDHRVRDMISGPVSPFRNLTMPVLLSQSKVLMAILPRSGILDSRKRRGTRKMKSPTQIHTTHLLLSVVKGINLGSLQIRIPEQPNAWSFGAYGGSLA